MIKSNDVKKGTKGMMKNGWEFEVFDNARGPVRMCKVYGFETEIGSTYVHDWYYVIIDGIRHSIELSDSQKKTQKIVEDFFA